MLICECHLRLSRPMRAHEAPPLRIFFGKQFNDAVRAHACDSDGQPLYEYPRLQFKVIRSEAVLLGIGEGAELLQELWLKLDEDKLGGDETNAVMTDCETYSTEIEACDEPIEYSFLTPWLALNEKNFRSYTGSRNTKFRKDELSRILVGNCLGLAKSLGIRFAAHVDADCRKLTSIKTTVRGKGMVGFVGKFRVNLTLPNLIGLGKSVSRGFGTVSS